MDTQDAMGLLAIIAASAAPLLESEISSSDTSSSDEDDEVDTIPPASPRKLPKSRHYFDLVNNMDESEFRSHFRLGFGEY